MRHAAPPRAVWERSIVAADDRRGHAAYGSSAVNSNRSDNIPGITVRERFLLDKADEIGGPGVTAEGSTKIDELCKARGKGPRSEDRSG